MVEFETPRGVSRDPGSTGFEEEEVVPTSTQKECDWRARYEDNLYYWTSSQDL